VFKKNKKQKSTEGSDTLFLQDYEDVVCDEEASGWQESKGASNVAELHAV